MKFRAFGLAVILGGAVVLLATSNQGCEVLRALADGGTSTGSDGGGTTMGGGDGGGGAVAAVTATINCMGDACGKAGTLIGRVKACGTGGMVVKSADMAGQTLTMGTPITLAIPDVPVGMHCLRVYLDVNTNNMQDTGDVIPATDEVNIDVQATGATTSIDLTQLKM
jgi:hypothetical protein